MLVTGHIYKITAPNGKAYIGQHETKALAPVTRAVKASDPRGVTMMDLIISLHRYRGKRFLAPTGCNHCFVQGTSHTAVNNEFVVDFGS